MTVEDDRWALRHLKDGSISSAGVGSYRYKDPDGICHRAIWTGEQQHWPKWASVCGLVVTVKLQEADPVEITCIRCLGGGA